MNISIIVVSFNTKELLLGCLASIFETIKSEQIVKNGCFAHYNDL